VNKEFLERQIIQSKQTIEKLNEYKGRNEKFQQRLLADAKSFLKQLQEIKENHHGES
jgi:hypothetical protein